ncbi:hypothetical protein AB0L40_24735 [Patulibacter sp. NPDC049589]|uniref:hypothetical protein n=1 Tax=Patulibacter sp. NPDC049589 TaxID=3154731 RepID=UPI00341EA1B4
MPRRRSRAASLAVVGLLAVAPAAASAAPSPAPPGAPFFLRYPTDQLGVPGDVETGELTPTNSLFTGRLEVALRSGTGMRPWTGGPRHLDETGLPVYDWGDVAGPVRTHATAFAVESAGVPVVHLRVVVHNVTGVRRPFGAGIDVGWLGAGLAETLKGDLVRAPYRFPRGVVAASPGLLQQPGDAFDPTWTSAWDGDVLTRSGSPLLSARTPGVGGGPGKPAGPGATVGPGPTVGTTAPEPTTATGPTVDAAPPAGGAGTGAAAGTTRAVGKGASVPRTGTTAERTTAALVTPDSVTGRLRLRGTLRPHGTRTIDVVVPLRAVPAGHPALADGWGPAMQRLRAAWRPRLDRAMSLSTPDPALDRAWKAGLLTILTSRYRDPEGRWVQTPNKFQYQASWIRDTAMIAHTLDLVGLHREAGEDVEYLTRWRDWTGLLQSRDGQFDGMGQALWSFGDHVARSGDLATAERLLPVADAAMDWVTKRLVADPQWILPPSDPKDDDEHAVGHATGDLVWLAGGTRRVVALATAVGDEDRARAWTAIADQVAAIARQRTAEAAVDGVVPSVLDNPAGRRWGELWLAWPTGLMAPSDPLVVRTMAAAKADEHEGLALWGGRLHLYLGLRRLHTELLAGHRDDVVAGLYATLAHLTSTGGTWEQGTAPYGSREVYRALGPHAWAAADLMSLAHDMLAREQGDGVRLLDAVPRAWLRAGSVTRVRRAHTSFGPVDVELRATRTGAVLRWDADVPAGTPLRFRAPSGTTAVRLPGLRAGRRELLLPGRRGTLKLRWRTGATVRGAPTTATVSDALRAAYARRGR